MSQWTKSEKITFPDNFSTNGTLDPKDFQVPKVLDMAILKFQPLFKKNLNFEKKKRLPKAQFWLDSYDFFYIV